MERRAELLVEHLAEAKNSPMPWPRPRQDVGAEHLPELHVHVLVVSMRKPSTPNSSIQNGRCRPCLDHLAALGQVVEAEEVAVQRVLAG